MKTSIGGGYQHPEIIATIYNLKCLLTNKNYKAYKEIGRYDPFTRKKRRQIETACESDQKSASTATNVKMAIVNINMITEVNETMS